MMRTLSAGTAVTLFLIAFVALAANVDRGAAAASLLGLAALSMAVLLHVSDRRHD